MLVGMSSEIIPIAYHINLTVLAGILLGPWLSIISAVIVNVMLALLGHGGVTVIGLNTLVISTEMIAGGSSSGRWCACSEGGMQASAMASATRPLLPIFGCKTGATMPPSALRQRRR